SRHSRTQMRGCRSRLVAAVGADCLATMVGSPRLFPDRLPQSPDRLRELALELCHIRSWGPPDHRDGQGDIATEKGPAGQRRPALFLVGSSLVEPRGAELGDGLI